jgi:hypothetical protein
MRTELEIPADAVLIGPWEPDLRLRGFDGKEWVIEHNTHDGRHDDIVVTIVGAQHADGRIERRIAIGCLADPFITAAEVRKLATALDAAADAADKG